MNSTEYAGCVTTGSMSDLKEKNQENDTIKKKMSSIYSIINTVTGKFYIGSTINLKERWSEHKRFLKLNIHHSRHLQRAWNKYGADKFILLELEQVPREMQYSVEQCYINQYWTEKRRDYLYNTAKDTLHPMAGLKFTAQQRQRMSESHKGIPCSEEAKRKISLSHIGMKHSLETIEKLKSYKKSADHIKKLSIANRGKKLSEERKRKITIAVTGKNNPRFDFKIYTFKSTLTEEEFTGTQFDFYNKYNLHKGNVCQMIKGNYKSVKGWIVANALMANIPHGLIQHTM